MRYEEISLAKLFVSPLNTRKDLLAGQEDSGIEDLASDIRNHGLLNPLLVRLASDGRYEVLCCCRFG
jgi:ParB-like chromosome segregation protein Spo0J